MSIIEYPTVLPIDNSINTTIAPDFTVAQKLKMLRELAKLSQEQLGQRLNVSAKTISAWESEEREISLNNAKAICELFEIPNSYFLFNDCWNKLHSSLQFLIKKYCQSFDFKLKIEKIIATCKQKIESDGIPFKKDYLPVFDYEEKGFSSYGIFDEKSLPIQISSHKKITFKDKIEDIKNYSYSTYALALFELYDIIKDLT